MCHVSAEARWEGICFGCGINLPFGGTGAAARGHRHNKSHVTQKLLLQFHITGQWEATSPTDSHGKSPSSICFYSGRFVSWETIWKASSLFFFFFPVFK